MLNSADRFSHPSPLEAFAQASTSRCLACSSGAWGGDPGTAEGGVQPQGAPERGGPAASWGPGGWGRLLRGAALGACSVSGDTYTQGAGGRVGDRVAGVVGVERGELTARDWRGWRGMGPGGPAPARGVEASSVLRKCVTWRPAMGSCLLAAFQRPPRCLSQKHALSLCGLPRRPRQKAGAQSVASLCAWPAPGGRA